MERNISYRTPNLIFLSHIPVELDYRLIDSRAYGVSSYIESLSIVGDDDFCSQLNDPRSNCS